MAAFSGFFQPIDNNLVNTANLPENRLERDVSAVQVEPLLAGDAENMANALVLEASHKHFGGGSHRREVYRCRSDRGRKPAGCYQRCQQVSMSDPATIRCSAFSAVASVRS
jgi:hypothetical protein